MRVAPMIGKRFGRWTVLERVPRPQFTASQAAFYLCRCDCGTERVINSATLRSGSSKSCGCLRREVSSRILAEYKARKKEGETKHD